jgi:tripartite-type tricarboxylate transporter receptor subunit TctC
MPRTLSLMLRAALAFWLGLGMIAPTLAQQPFPNRPIRFVVGFSAGGITDIVARITAEHVRLRLGQPVTVENRTGANGVLAAMEVLRAPADGHTVLISNSSTLTLNPLLARKPPYEASDFAPLSLMVSYPFVIATNPTSEKTGAAATLPEFIRLARERPGQFTYGSTGNGGLVHLGFELLNSLADIRMVHVPYRGASAAQVALLGKEVDVVFENPTSLPVFRSGRLRALAVTGPERWRDLPDVPTVSELGYPGFDSSSWVGAVVPARTPPAVVRALAEAIRSAAADPAVRAQLLQHGNLPMLDPQQFAAKIRAESEVNAKIIRQSNISVD